MRGHARDRRLGESERDGIARRPVRNAEMAKTTASRNPAVNTALA
jgi:hypothetical protein